MDKTEWIEACAERLAKQWPRVDRDDLEHLAGALHEEEHWRAQPPEQAAQNWLAQGIPQAA